MAEGIVNFVVGKLADVTVREVLSLYRVDAQVETVRRELGRMQAFLKDADKKLLNESTKRRIVVSIWGAGGIGKTTLTQKVYNSNDVKQRFELRISIVISQNFQQIDTSGKIIKQAILLSIRASYQKMEGIYLPCLMSLLEAKRTS